MKLCEVPIGTKILEPASGIRFLVADHKHMGYPGTTLVTDEAVLSACFDAAEPENPDAAIAESGNNFYPESNIHQWLNATTADWYRPRHPYDAPPVAENMDMRWEHLYASPMVQEGMNFEGDYSYLQEPGFLSWFPQAFVDALEITAVPCHCPPDPNVVRHGPPLPVYLQCKVFLPSALEIGSDACSPGTEGHRIRLFNDPRMLICAPTAHAVHRPEGYEYTNSAYFWLLRSPQSGTKNRCLACNPRPHPGDYVSGHALGAWCNLVYGVRPVMNMKNDVEVSEPDPYGVREFVL